MRLSPATLNLTLECPLCGWEKINTDIRRPRGPFPSLPGAIDRVVRAASDENRVEAWGSPLPTAIERIFPEGWKLMTPLPKSLKVQWDGTDVDLYGLVDDIYVTRTGLHVIVDHKTRSSVPKKCHDAYVRQVHIYWLAMMLLGYKMSRLCYLIYWTPEPLAYGLKGVRLVPTKKQIKVREAMIYRAIGEAIVVLKGDKPEPSEDCEFCRYRGLVKEVG